MARAQHGADAPLAAEQDVGAHRYALETDLRTALADDAFHLEFQPIVDLSSGAVVGLEALARWAHPERGPVSPSSFVPVAELSGLAPELDRWVIQRALHDMAGLRRAGVVPDDVYLAVNLSAASLTDTALRDDLVSWTEECGLPATQLVLEITETTIMQNTGVAVELLQQLRRHGFRVAMDDFGTGYSSLAHLRELPVSALKIDRSFIADIAEQRDALAIVAWIVDLAQAMGVAVVAEGVETAEQVALLQGLGCASAQGWFWSPAAPVTQLVHERTWPRPLAAGCGATAPGSASRRGTREASVPHGLQRLLSLHQEGASLAAIAAALDAEGLRRPSGARWDEISVAHVIADQIRRCAGRLEPNPSGRRSAGPAEMAGRPPS